MGYAARPRAPAPTGPAARRRRAGFTVPEDVVAAIERRWPWVLGGMMLVEAIVLLYMGRGLTFYFDEWDFVQNDYGGGLHSLLVAHVGNISVLPAAVYKVLYHLAGLNHYAIYRLAVIVLHLLAAGLVFVPAARRIPRFPALLACALVLFLGAAWEDLLWPFQIGYMLSIVGGLGAWVALDGDGHGADVLAMLCVVLATGSSSLGLAVIVGVAVELAWQRQWRRGWIVLVPAAIYLLWYLGYGESQVTRNALINAPGFAADLAAAAFGGLFGRGLDWGRPLAVVGVALLALELSQRRYVSPRLAGLLASAVALWTITAAARSTISAPETSRYVYMGAVLIVLVAVELIRTVAIPARASLMASAVVAVAAVTGLTVLHAGSGGLRATSQVLKAELAALEVAGRYTPPTYRPDPQRAPQIVAASYLHSVRSIGSSPAESRDGLSAAEPAARAAADQVLLALEPPRLAPAAQSASAALAPAPELEGLLGGVAAQQAQCISFQPAAARTLTAQLTPPAGGAVVTDRGGGPVALGLKRYGDGYVPVAAAVAPRTAESVRLPADGAGVPWRMQMSSSSPFVVCGLLP